MSFNPREVSTERLSSLDQDGYRQYIHPEDVNGKFRKRRNLFYSFLIIIFLVVPWLKFKGEQLILLSIPERKFVFWGNVFWAHDAPIVFFLLAFFTIGLTFVTSVWGRVWCGWACPQTVFIDAIYRRVEGWIEGNFRQRRILQNEPWSKSKVTKKIIKWTLFFLISSHIAHSFVAYFVGADKLFWITTESPTKSWTLFLVVQFLTFVFLLDFGWFREQFCIIMCPYGRFQSVILDANSMVVAYDHKRGEPRKGSSKEKAGDCVDCFKCVNVCPTGIDIRNGLQLECIACTACMDACDSVMEKVGKPLGLIRYSTQNKIEGINTERKYIRPAIYLSVLIFLISSFFWIVLGRKPVEFKIIRAVETPYQLSIENDKKIVINQFKVHLKSQSSQDSKIDLELLGEDNLVNSELKMIAPTFPLTLSKEVDMVQPIFIKGDISLLGDKHKYPFVIRLKIKTNDSETIQEEKLTLLGP